MHTWLSSSYFTRQPRAPFYFSGAASRQPKERASTRPHADATRPCDSAQGDPNRTCAPALASTPFQKRSGGGGVRAKWPHRRAGKVCGDGASGGGAHLRAWRMEGARSDLQAASRKSSVGRQRLRPAAEGERGSSDWIQRRAASVALLPLLLLYPLSPLPPPPSSVSSPHSPARIFTQSHGASRLPPFARPPRRPERHLLLTSPSHPGRPHAAGAGSESGNSRTHLTGGRKEGSFCRVRRR